MTYAEATRHVEGLAILGMRFGLERMNLLLRRLGTPQRAAPAVHVVGTNGKSSTARLAAAALRSQGLRVGTYLSPHVTGWRDRIEIDGRAIREATFAEAVTAVDVAARRLHLGEGDHVTQFEVLTAAAFWTFARAGVGAMVIEAGLGGRYDATNVMPAGTVVALTNVALEHTELLGRTEEQIAMEKLAVVPDASDLLVVGRLSARAAPGVAAVLHRRGLRAWRLGQEIQVARRGPGLDVRTPGGRYAGLRLAISGGFQHDNLAVALGAAERLLGHPLEVPPLRGLIGRVRMPGRLEVVDGRPLILLDGAHNPAGVEALVEALPGVAGRRRPVVVLSVLGDKDAAAMIAPLARSARRLVATRSSHTRAESPEILVHLARLEGIDAEAVEEPVHALARAKEIATPRGVVLVCGSLYLLADLRRGLLRGAQRPLI